MLPLTLLLAAAMHLAAFYAIDLRPKADSLTIGEKKYLQIGIFAKQAPAVQNTHIEPVVHVQKSVKPAPLIKKAMEAPASIEKRRPAPKSETETSPKVSAETETDAKYEAPVHAVQKSTPAADVPKLHDISMLKLRYSDKVRDIIAANKIYPMKARRRGIQGSVLVSFLVKTDGVIENASVVTSSGFDILDRTALQILADSSPLPIPPEEMDFSLPVSFLLN